MTQGQGWIGSKRVVAALAAVVIVKAAVISSYVLVTPGLGGPLADPGTSADAPDKPGLDPAGGNHTDQGNGTSSDPDGGPEGPRGLAPCRTVCLRL